MKKRLIAMCAVLSMSASLLAGCNIPVKLLKQALDNSTEAATTEMIGEATTEDSTEGISDATTQDANAGDDITPVEATLENPANIGEWVSALKYCSEDGQYHEVFYRITKVYTGDEAQAVVDKYNSEDHLIIFKEVEQDDICYGILEYEVYFPTDFPQASYGITTVDVDFGLCNTEDSGAIANYIGLSTTWDISVHPEINEFYAGDTFKGGQAVFNMVKDFDDYYIKCANYHDDSDVTYTYVKVK